MKTPKNVYELAEAINERSTGENFDVAVEVDDNEELPFLVKAGGVEMRVRTADEVDRTLAFYIRGRSYGMDIATKLMNRTHRVIDDPESFSGTVIVETPQTVLQRAADRILGRR